MRHEPDIDLTPTELARIASFAEQRGVSVEEAATQLAQKTITKFFVIPRKASAVVPLRALKRES
ncbi:hypothetical protein ISN76_13095 [Dyella halodurans]|uniref:DUF3606 domain-containing protein n=1 Tax=Dyella halodurans TaxID=1920171 RepID=A0ABV9C075_9GAMM|nr:hypothetical protein [Dyella halodurans]